MEILQHAPGVMLVVTSRERLLLQEEWVYSLQGLGYPTNFPESVVLVGPEGIEQQYDALSLFYQRARQALHTFKLDASTLPAAVRICQMLEGLPLGVELAAAAIWEQTCDENRG